MVWPKIYINVQIAKELRLLFIKALTDTFGERPSINSWNEVVDLAVYEDNGLRMVGCRKIGICKVCKNKKDLKTDCQECEGLGRKDEGRVYKPKLVMDCKEPDEYLHKISNDYSIMLLETCIYNYMDFELTELKTELKITSSAEETKAKRVMKRNSTATVKTSELEVKLENFIHRNFKEHYSKIRVKKVTKGDDNTYYVEPDDNFCMNVNRNHNSSGIYFLVKPTGICQRCYCKKDTLDGRLNGPCSSFASKEVSFGKSKTLTTLLFGNRVSNMNTKKLSNISITRSTLAGTLDLAVNKSKLDVISKEMCLKNCKNILWQLENDLLNK